jgi:hypothetical protein
MRVDVDEVILRLRAEIVGDVTVQVPGDLDARHVARLLAQNQRELWDAFRPVLQRHLARRMRQFAWAEPVLVASDLLTKFLWDVVQNSFPGVPGIEQTAVFFEARDPEALMRRYQALADRQRSKSGDN